MWEREKVEEGNKLDKGVQHAGALEEYKYILFSLCWSFCIATFTPG